MFEAAKICEAAFAVTPAAGWMFPFQQMIWSWQLNQKQMRAVGDNDLKSFCALVHLWLLPWLGRQL